MAKEFLHLPTKIIRRKSDVCNTNHLRLTTMPRMQRLPSRSAEDDEIDCTFTPLEVELLHSSFHSLKNNVSDLAPKVLERVEVVEGAMECYQRACEHITNDWMRKNLGLILLSGIERFVLRLDSPQALRTLSTRIKLTHDERYEVKPAQLAGALRACQQLFIENFKAMHGHEQVSSCPSCIAWVKFFAVTANLILSKKTD